MTQLNNIEFQKKLFVAGTIETLTGLHIGGNSTEMGIGGADSIVIRDPITNHPYIPGSSLRGKMRSLLEQTRGEMTVKLDNNHECKYIKELEGPLAGGAKIKSAGPSSDPEALSSRLFGISIDKQERDRPEKIVPQRLIVRDARLANPENLEKARNTDMPMTEVKTEVAIDRITSQANPRQIERVPAGARFAFDIILNLYAGDTEDDCLGALFQCLELLQDDYLGGHGSRGYGRVRVAVETIARKTVADYQNRTPAQPVEIEIPETLRPEA